jgi:exosortase D (VPLPA-CTERM-specific)
MNSTTNAVGTGGTPQRMAVGLLIVAAIALAALFRDGISLMFLWWQEPEYNHGYFIPVIALYLFWLKAAELRDVPRRPSWAGVAVVVLGLALLLLGELSAVYVISQYALLVTIWGMALAVLGWRGVKLIWTALVYLIFMIPLPRFIQFNLSAELQLISSQLGVLVTRLFGIPVYVEGNVIDLGVFKLQVADACSGLRYLFPLTSFGFLCAVLFHGSRWQRVVLFLSTIPITVLMNSFRIGVIGVLVDRFGIEQAEGFLHYFEGWVVFMACVGILFLEMLLFARMNRQSLGQAFALDIPPLSDFTDSLRRLQLTRQFIAGTATIVLALVVSLGIGRPVEMIPQRNSLRSFPLVIGDWRGQEQTVDQSQLDELKASDYLSAIYGRRDDHPVSIWLAYYDSQRKGASVHSPRACLPGGGWRMEVFETRAIPNVGPAGEPLAVNRAVISMGQNRNLVYYWFEQRGRLLTNEYLVKWFIFWDALKRNRTDGALVRLITEVPEGTDIEVAEKRLQEFVRTVNPQLDYFLPQGSAVMQPAPAATTAAVAP